jgi:hypothetical protein
MTWCHPSGTYAKIFGDNDRLPTGNLLGSFWMSNNNVSEYLSRDAGEQFDVRAMEIVRETKLRAWSVSAQGLLCDEGVCDNSLTGEWRMYSVERFFVAPLIHTVSCASGALSFQAHNNFKQNNPDPASYEILDGDGEMVRFGTFAFRPHWAPSYIALDLGAGSALASGASVGTIRVRNKWGDKTDETFTCDTAAPTAMPSYAPTAAFAV